MKLVEEVGREGFTARKSICRSKVPRQWGHPSLPNLSGLGLPIGRRLRAILVNGEPHVSYVYPSLKQLPVGPETTFSVGGVTQAGPLTVTLTRGQMTYTIAPYNYDNLSCTSVTYPGHT